VVDKHDRYLKATQVSDENQVEEAKIKLKDVARAWWLAEEARLESPSLGTSSQKISMRDSSP